MKWTRTNVPSYWLNWRFSICALLIFSSMAVAGVVIFKREGQKSRRERREEGQGVSPGTLYQDEAWKTCVKRIHPAWLLVYRIISFAALFTLISLNVADDSFGIYFFYTQWTFTLVTIYFGLGSLLSIYGCYKYHNRAVGEDSPHHVSDAEQGTYVAPMLGENLDASNMPKIVTGEECEPREGASAYVYIFQIIYQICGGAVILTDSVFWLILYPAIREAGYSLDFMMLCMHSFNFLFLFGESILNCLRFPFFRISYFVLYTGTFVVFQWILHFIINMRWPYPFLDLSFWSAPLWYLGVGLTHFPCYGLFALVIRLKHCLFSRIFTSFQVER